MSYASEVLADSPAVFYECEEASGSTISDSSGNGEDGSVLGTIQTYEVPILSGTGNGFNMADLTDPMGAYNKAAILVPHTAWTPGSGNWTIEAVVQRDNTGAFPGFNQTFYEGYDGVTNVGAWVFGSVQTGDVPRVGWSWLGNANYQQEYPDDGLPHLIQVGYSIAAGGTITCTVDGVNGTPDTGVGTFAFGSMTDSGFGISTDDAHLASMSGKLDCPALYNTALSLARRKAHAKAAGTYKTHDLLTQSGGIILASSGVALTTS